MPNGTELNKVFAARIHKSNAEEVAAAANEEVEYLSKRLLLLAATSPGEINEEPWHDYVGREVPEIIDALLDAALRKWMASYIRDEPEDCKDELVEADWSDDD